MNKKTWIFIVLIIVAIGIGIFMYFRNSDNKADETNTTNNTYEANRTSSDNVNSTLENQNTQSEENVINTTQNITDSTPSEPQTEIANFATKIYTKDPARQNNISITCNTLNGTIVKNGEIFSFCNKVGQATTAKGYQEADIFDKDGNKKKGLGGGNCQISTTLYNALLSVPSLVVTERHAHSNYVPYIERGKDAAVAYGSYDLKFRNDSGKDIKIVAESTPDAVTIKLLQ